MGTEAQKLITVSLEKIANFRRRRREMSLHKNLLVTTVIHKARVAIMEETYYMYAAAAAAGEGPTPDYAQPPPPTYGCPQVTGDPLGMEWDNVCEQEQEVQGEGEAEEEDKENLRPRGHKRHHRAGTADDESSPQKRRKWDEEQLLEQEQEEDDDTSHALRLVSVLMSGAATSTTLRLARSFAKPELTMCAKDVRTLMDGCGARAPMAIAV